MVGVGPTDEQLTWEPLVLTLDKIHWLWDQLKAFPVVFDDFGRNNFDEFVAKLLSPRNAFADIGPGVGLACAFGVRPGLDAVVHLVMFDRRLRGREPLLREILLHCFSVLKLHRLTAMIPSDTRPAINLAKRLGWKHEGILREAMLRDGKFIDVHIFGLFKQELLDG